jgi:hypothetical protein
MELGGRPDAWAGVPAGCTLPILGLGALSPRRQWLPMMEKNMADDLRNADRNAAKLKAIYEILDDTNDQSAESPPRPLAHKPVKVWVRKKMRRIK